MKWTLLICACAALATLPNPALTRTIADPIVCDVVGEGYYFYEPVEIVDYYELEGRLESCRGALDHADPVTGRFLVEGGVAAVGLSGPGEIRIRWQGDRSSRADVTMTGLPESLTMTGKFDRGSYYEGERFTMTTVCTLQSTQSCFQPGSASFEYTGELTILR